MFLITIPYSIFAEVWVSIDVPTVYRFSGKGNSILSTGSTIHGAPSGAIVHASLPMLPVLGVEKYKIAITSASSDEPIATIEVDFINIGYYHSLKYVRFLIGYGQGTIKTRCGTGYCTGYSFKTGEASQLYGHLGVPLFGKVDFYLSAHWVTGKNEFTYASQEGELNLSGVLYSFGIKAGW